MANYILQKRCWSKKLDTKILSIFRNIVIIHHVNISHKVITFCINGRFWNFTKKFYVWHEIYKHGGNKIDGDKTITHFRLTTE